MTFRPDRRHFLRGIGGTAALSLLSTSACRAQTQPAPGGNSAATARMDTLLAQAISILQFIPDALHAGIREERAGEDLAPFIQAAIRHVDSLPGGGALFFPPGAYAVSGIDASNSDSTRFTKALHLIGAGRFATKIRALRPNGILLNGLGRNAMQVESLQFLSDGVESRAGILLGRSRASPNCNGNQFRDVLVSGNYGEASVISIGAESTSWTQCRFENASRPARHRCLITSHDPAVLSAETARGLPFAPGPNTDNVMSDCEFYTPFDGARPLLFAGSAGYGMTMCSVIGGSASGSRLISYRPAGDTFTGPVTWMNPHLEVIGSGNILHFLEAPAGVSYFRAINNYSGNYVVANGTTILGADPGLAAAQPVLLQSTWTVPMAPWGISDLSFRVFGLSDSAVDFRLGDNVGTLEISGFASNSRTRAAIERIRQVVTSPPGH